MFTIIVARTDKDKERLGNIMAYGEDVAPPNSATIQAAREKMWQEQMAELEREDVDRFDECKSITVISRIEQDYLCQTCMLIGLEIL